MKSGWYSEAQVRYAKAAIKASELDTKSCRSGGEDSPLVDLTRALMPLAVMRGYDPMQVVRQAVEHWACDISDPSEGCLDTEARAAVRVTVQKCQSKRLGRVIDARCAVTRRYKATKRVVP
jgi:hypothetical protein